MSDTPCAPSGEDEHRCYHVQQHHGDIRVRRECPDYPLHGGSCGRCGLPAAPGDPQVQAIAAQDGTTGAA